MKDSYIFYTDKLDKDYLAVFEQIALYVQSQNVDDDTKEERLGELLDIFLSAAEREKPVRDITGNDLERFCKTFCSDFGVKNRVLFFADWFKSIAKILIFVSVLDLIFPENGGDFSGGASLWDSLSTLNISGYFIGITVSGILAAAVNLLLRRMMFRQKRVSMRILKAVSAAVAVLGFVIVFSFLSMNSMRLFECPAWIVFALSAVYVCLHYLLRGRYIKRDKVKFFDLVKEESSSEFPKEMEKKFAKARQRSIRRGKGELSLEKFLEKEERDVDRTEKTGFVYYLLPVAIVGGGAIIRYLTGGFESLADEAVQGGIVLAVQYPIMIGLWKVVKLGAAERRKWIEGKREEIRREVPGQGNRQGV